MPPIKTRLRRVAYGLGTVLGLKKRGFFIPYAHAEGTGPAARKGYPALKPLFEQRGDAFRRFLRGLEDFADDIKRIGSEAPPQPRFEQDWFPRLDALSHYAMVRWHKPRLIVEVGSGHSTRFLARAISDGGLDTRLHCIDPAPRADLSRLDVTLQRCSLQEAQFDIFSDLGKGDFLCIDSSHILMPGSDVDLVLNQVLPALPAGVFVFFHDMFLPGAYPNDWPFTVYNEQSGVAVLLQAGYRVVFSSAYATRHLSGDVAASLAGKLALLPGAVENGLWLEKTLEQP